MASDHMETKRDCSYFAAEGGLIVWGGNLAPRNAGSVGRPARGNEISARGAFVLALEI